MLSPSSHRLRYLLGAVLCAVMNNVILILGDRFGFGYVALSVVCFFVTGTFAYVFHSTFTFRQDLLVRSYIAFMTGTVIGLPVSIFLLYALYDLAGLPMPVAAPVLTVLMVIYNYAVAKLSTTGSLRR